jgi:hypothetical protein
MAKKAIQEQAPPQAPPPEDERDDEREDPQDGEQDEREDDNQDQQEPDGDEEEDDDEPAPPERKSKKSATDSLPVVVVDEGVLSEYIRKSVGLAIEDVIPSMIEASVDASIKAQLPSIRGAIVKSLEKAFTGHITPLIETIEKSISASTSNDALVKGLSDRLDEMGRTAPVVPNGTLVNTKTSEGVIQKGIQTTVVDGDENPTGRLTREEFSKGNEIITKSMELARQGLSKSFKSEHVVAFRNGRLGREYLAKLDAENKALVEQATA